MKEYLKLKKEVQEEIEKEKNDLALEILSVASWLADYTPVKNIDPLAMKKIEIGLSAAKDKIHWLRDIARKANDIRREARPIPESAPEGSDIPSRT